MLQRPLKNTHNVTDLLLVALQHEAKEFNKENIRLRVIGSKAKLGAALVTAIHDAEKMTENNSAGTILLCLDYGGQQEIVDAVKRIAASGVDPAEISADLIAEHLYAPDVPPLDLIIRTSGEQRLSNFMTWEAAYSELAFHDKYWPEFSEADLKSAMDHYKKRQRRFGK